MLNHRVDRQILSPGTSILLQAVKYFEAVPTSSICQMCALNIANHLTVVHSSGCSELKNLVLSRSCLQLSSLGCIAKLCIAKPWSSPQGLSTETALLHHHLVRNSSVLVFSSKHLVVVPDLHQALLILHCTVVVTHRGVEVYFIFCSKFLFWWKASNSSDSARCSCCHQGSLQMAVLLKYRHWRILS